jgi:hypothetical protein
MVQLNNEEEAVEVAIMWSATLPRCTTTEFLSILVGPVSETTPTVELTAMCTPSISRFSKRALVDADDEITLVDVVVPSSCQLDTLLKSSVAKTTFPETVEVILAPFELSYRSAFVCTLAWSRNEAPATVVHSV